MSDPVLVKVNRRSRTGRIVTTCDVGTNTNPTRDVGTSTTEDNILVPMEIGNHPMPPGQQPQQPPQEQAQQRRQQVPPPLQPLNVDSPDRTTILGMYRSLRYLDSLIKKIQDDTQRHLREALPPILKINSNGRMRFVEPTVVALYVVNGSETSKCSGCNLMTQSACGNCRQEPFCSSYCLQKSWSSHEGECRLAVAATAQGVTEALLRA